MEKTRYLFVSYTLAVKGNTVTGDLCYMFNTEKQVTIQMIREGILDEVQNKMGINANGYTPAIIGLQVLDEDVAKMLYELE